jgi:hypothetical protein
VGPPRGGPGTQRRGSTMADTDPTAVTNELIAAFGAEE